jgi:hypothetical protein
MSVLTISDSNAKLNWSHLPGRVQKNRESNITEEKNTLTFVSDFTSPADETAKLHSSKTGSEKSTRRSRPFSHTSENWIG